MFCIYKVTNNINGKTYIGQHKYSDDACPMGSYKGSGKLLRRAYKKYGFENFSIEVLYQRIRDAETADSMEVWMISKERRENQKGVYNIMDGGQNRRLGTTAWNKGIHLDEEYKRKLSLSHKGKPNLKNRGRKMTTEQIEHNREIQIKLRKEHPEYWETEAYLNRGKKVSISKIGHTVSEETRKKISETLKSKKYKENV